MKTKKLVYGGLLLALGIMMPQAFHFTGVPQSGAVFLPMHIPVLLAGFLLGPWYGLAIGLITPAVSSLITGMPVFARLPFMMIELAAYGMVSGYFFHRGRWYKKKLGIYMTLLTAMAAGRAAYALALWIAADLLHIPGGGPLAAVTAIVTGIPGIAVQLLIIPAIIYFLRKGGFLNEFITEGESHFK